MIPSLQSVALKWVGGGRKAGRNSLELCSRVCVWGGGSSSDPWVSTPEYLCQGGSPSQTGLSLPCEGHGGSAHPPSETL